MSTNSENFQQFFMLDDQQWEDLRAYLDPSVDQSSDDPITTTVSEFWTIATNVDAMPTPAPGDVLTTDGKTVYWGQTTAEVGSGLPEGGTLGQLLAKQSNANFEVEWIDPPVNENYLTSVSYSDIETTNAPADGQVIRYNVSSDSFEWADPTGSADNKLDDTFAVFKDVGTAEPPSPVINNGETVPQTAMYTKSFLQGSVRTTQHLAKNHSGEEIIFFETTEIL